MESQKLHQEIRKLEESARRSSNWADKVEKSKIGYDPRKDTNRSIGTRAYLGEKSKRMQQSAIQEKEELLKNLEQPAELKPLPLVHHKEVYIKARDLALSYHGEVCANHIIRI